MKIENDAVFELVQAHRMLEKPYSIECEWNHLYGWPKFERTEDQHDYIKRSGIRFLLA
jgi:hypothetical protein